MASVDDEVMTGDSLAEGLFCGLLVDKRPQLAMNGPGTRELLVDMADFSVAAAKVLHEREERASGSDGSAHHAGADAIRDARQKQVTKLGYTVGHDCQYAEGTLRVAALAILLDDKDSWPWRDEESLERFRRIKLKSYTDRMAIAGALIAAEIDLEKWYEDNPGIRETAQHTRERESKETKDYG